MLKLFCSNVINDSTMSKETQIWILNLNIYVKALGNHIFNNYHKAYLFSTACLSSS